MATTPSVNPAPGAPATPPARDARRATDVTLSAVFWALQLIFVLVSLTFSLIFGTIVGLSGSHPYAGTAWLVCVLAPAIVFVLSLSVGLFLLITKRTAWIVSVVGLVAGVVIWFWGWSLFAVQ